VQPTDEILQTIEPLHFPYTHNEKYNMKSPVVAPPGVKGACAEPGRAAHKVGEATPRDQSCGESLT